MMAGNLLVTVHGLRETEGNLLVRLHVGDQKQQTDIHWSGESGEWNELINFYQVLRLFSVFFCVQLRRLVCCFVYGLLYPLCAFRGTAVFEALTRRLRC